MRPMKAPKLENACLDRARRTRKRKSSRQKTLLIIRQYDTRLQPQHFLSMRQRVWWQQRVAQNKKQRKHPQPQTKEELQQWLIDFFLGSSMEIRSIRGIPAVLRICMIGWEAVVFNQPIGQWQIKLATSCK